MSFQGGILIYYLEKIIDYLSNIEDTTKTLFDKSPIGVITQKMETLKGFCKKNTC